MRDDELALLEHRNFIASIAMVAGLRPEGVVRRERGVALLASGVALRLFNQVLIEDDAASPEAVAEAVATMRELGFRYAVYLRHGLDDRFVPLMAELGLSDPDPEDPMPGMALHPIPAAEPAAGDVEIRRITDSAGFAEHVRTAALGFGLDEALAWSFMDQRMLDEPGASFYVGYVRGAPVVTGLGFRTDRIIGVYNIATIESARRRGYGAAMTARVASDGAEAGCDVAILQASTMGLRIYEHLGYRTVVRYRGFIELDEASSTRSTSRHGGRIPRAP